jgi:hypothetical protein
MACVLNWRHEVRFVCFKACDDSVGKEKTGCKCRSEETRCYPGTKNSGGAIREQPQREVKKVQRS